MTRSSSLLTLSVLCAIFLASSALPRLPYSGASEYGHMDSIRSGWGKRAGYGRYGADIQSGWGKRSDLEIQESSRQEDNSKNALSDDITPSPTSLSSKIYEAYAVSSFENVCEDIQALIDHHLSRALQYQKMVDESCSNRS